MKSLSERKKALRRELRRRGRELGPELRQEASRRICAKLVPLLQEIPAEACIASFMALPDEPDLSALLGAMPERAFAFPLICGAGQLRFHRVSSATRGRMQPGPFGLSEPDPERHPVVGLDELGGLLVPASGLSPAGYRLGKGGGFYDRLLARIDPGVLRIGVVFDCQLVASLPLERHDQPMHRVVTEAQDFPGAV